MSDRQKGLFRQLQLAGLGLVLAVVSLFIKEDALFWIGLGIFVFGLLRFMLIRKLIDKIDE